MTHLFSGNGENEIVPGAAELGDCVCELDMIRRWSKKKTNTHTHTHPH